MDQEAVRDLYDATYAAAYDERFLTGEPWAAAGAEFEVEVLTELLEGAAGRWLDVACGTGWFLSHFPDQTRAGLDLSPAMLARASAANPGVDFTEGSYLDDHADWTDAWAVVSCMWFAYGYVDTVADVEQVVANLARWTAPDGACFVPVCDLEDLSGGNDVAYVNPDTWTFGGPLRISAFVWSWLDEPYGKHHQNLVCPHLGHMVVTFGHWFEAIEVVRYPPFQPGWGSRKAIVARAKRPNPGAGPATVVTERVEAYREPPPEPADDTADEAGQAEADGSAEGAGVADAPSPRGAAKAWFALPRPLRRAASMAWHALPITVRDRIWPNR